MASRQHQKSDVIVKHSLCSLSVTMHITKVMASCFGSENAKKIPKVIY